MLLRPEYLFQKLDRPLPTKDGGTARLIALIVASTILGSCSSASNLVSDYLPAWAGGRPKNAPPRPGTPEYDALRQKLETEAARDKSKDSRAPKAE
jgi:hypothetical protein